MTVEDFCLTQTEKLSQITHEPAQWKDAFGILQCPFCGTVCKDKEWWEYCPHCGVRLV